MVKVVLKMFLAKRYEEIKKKKHDKNVKSDLVRTVIVTLIIALIILSLAFLLMFIMCNEQNNYAIVSAISAILLLLFIFLLDRYQTKKVWDDYIDYNNKLDQLSEVLLDLKYNEEKDNWYSKNKIKYLINECSELLNERSSPQKRATEFFKIMILPIISFVAGVISNKTAVELSLQFASVALFVVISIWGINQIIEFFDDITMKSSSVSTIESVRHMLSDLLVRDFGNEEEEDEHKSTN